MKQRIAKFSKVEFNDFLEAYAKYNSGEVDKDYVREIYDDIRLPGMIFMLRMTCILKTIIQSSFRQE